MAKKGEKVSAYGYVRFSSLANKDGDSVRRQQASIKAYCEQHGIQLVQFFIDEGVSGTLEYQDRPAFVDMLHHVAQNGTRLVIVSDQDRLSRQLLIQELIIRDFNQLGISIISVANGDLTNTDDEHANMVRQVIGSLIQMERHKLTRRLRIAREKVRQEKGKCEGRKKLSESNPDLLLAVLRLYRKRPKAPRRTYKNIASILTDEGYLTSRGTPISPNYVSVIIHKHKKGSYKV
jgi:DNA invertase Pin-like site-specific DNA recombinase